MKKQAIAILLVAAATLAGCKDFFDISNPQTLTTDNFPATMEQVDQLVTAAYAQDHAIGTYAFYWFPMGVWLYDHTTDLYGSYDERAFSQDNYSSIDSRYLTTTYTDLCKWMKLASTGIEGIEFYREHYGKTSDNAILDYDLGQCYFNRALAYWHAQIFFELNPDGLGFAKIDRVISDVEGLKLSRETVRDTWQFMIDDCNKAVELLKGHTEDEFRATEWAAKGLLAKVYMQSLYIFPENRDKAKALLEDIINNSGKHLVSSEIYKDMFFGNEANEHNAESLYELTMTSNPKQNGPWDNYTTGSGMPMVFAPWFMKLMFKFDTLAPDPLTLRYDIDITDKSSEWGNNYVHDRNIARFGFWNFYGDTVPRLTLNPNYKHNPKKRDYTLENFPYMLSKPNYRADALALKNDPDKVDPRLIINAGQPFVDEFIDGKGRTTYYNRSSEVNTHPDRLAWQHRKFTNIHGLEKGSAPYGWNQSSNCNFYIIRLADIYLLYAELIADTEPGKALEYINKVHRRAYGYDPNTACPYDYANLTARTRAYFDTDPLANNPLRYERWAELFAEGQWWFDIRRYRIGDTEAAYYEKTSHGPITWKGNESYVQPIPQLELERNKNMKQSTGYPSI